MPAEAKPIPDKVLAEHWGCSPSALSKLRRRRNMPKFLRLADADAWRAEHVGSPRLAPRELSRPAAGSKMVLAPPQPTGDFVADAKAQAEHLHALAWQSLAAAVEAGDAAAVATRSRLFGEAVKQAAAARDRWIQQQTIERSLVDRDEARQALAQVLTPLRRACLRLDRRFAPRFADPSAAASILRDIGDSILREAAGCEEQVDRDLERAFDPEAEEGGRDD